MLGQTLGSCQRPKTQVSYHPWWGRQPRAETVQCGNGAVIGKAQNTLKSGQSWNIKEGFLGEEKDGARSQPGGWEGLSGGGYPAQPRGENGTVQGSTSSPKLSLHGVKGLGQGGGGFILGGRCRQGRVLRETTGPRLLWAIGGSGKRSLWGEGVDTLAVWGIGAKDAEGLHKKSVHGAREEGLGSS